MPRAKSIIWLAKAEDSLDKQLDYVEQRDFDAALRLVDSIKASVDRIARFPLSARPGRISGTRELVVSGTPFLVIYRVEADAIIILRVIHHRQKWPPARS